MYQLSTKLKGATVEDLKRENKCINLLKSENIKMRFKNVGDLQNTHVAVFADAVYGNLEGLACQPRLISFLMNGNSQCYPISWASKKSQKSSEMANYIFNKRNDKGRTMDFI